MRITQDEQQIINEIHRQGRILTAEEARLRELANRAELLGNHYALTHRPKAYTIEFSFEPGNKTAQTKEFTVSGGKFKAFSVSTNFSIVGQAAVDTNPNGIPASAPGQLINLSCGEGGIGIGPSARQAFFDFFWTVRDTSSDFSLQDLPQPSVVLASGHAAPSVLPVPMLLETGASLEMQIDPFYSRSVNSIAPQPEEGIYNAREYKLLVKFWGHEEIT